MHSDPLGDFIHFGETLECPKGYFTNIWGSENVFEYESNHWGCILADMTHAFNEQQDPDGTGKYFLRSELLACVTLLRHQMNEILWDVWEQEFVGWKPNIKDGPIKVSILRKTIQRRG